RRTFLQNLARVPYVEGVNNHMGSHLTRLPEAMQPLMRILREEGLFFVDSKTSARSVAAQAAAAAGLPWAARQIFLDHRQDEAYMQAAWQKALACQATGHACVVIGHPHQETVDFLERMLGGNSALEPGKQLRLTPIRALLHAPRPASPFNAVASGLPAAR
ncbi:MAG: divergent polysaccharide deacetylase family protein, partial [Mariprofundaceae bacterium]